MVFALVFLAACLPVFVSASEADTLPATISYRAPIQFPESADWDRRNSRFIVGSLRRGNLGVIRESGKFSVFVKDKEYHGNRTQGVLVDSKRNRVVTAIYGGGPSKAGGTFGAIAGYNLSSKKRLFFIRLDTYGPQVATGSFPNDVAVEYKTGILWVSDAARALLWQVDPKNSKVNVIQSSVFTSGNATCPQAAGISLNGIVHSSTGYILVGNTYTGNIIKVYLKKRVWRAVVVKGVNIPCVDGLRFRSDGALVAVTGYSVFLIKTSNNWKTAKVADRVPQDPTIAATAAAIRKGTPYISYAYFYNLGESLNEWQLNKTSFSS